MDDEAVTPPLGTLARLFGGLVFVLALPEGQFPAILSLGALDRNPDPLNSSDTNGVSRDKVVVRANTDPKLASVVGP